MQREVQGRTYTGEADLTRIRTTLNFSLHVSPMHRHIRHSFCLARLYHLRFASPALRPYVCLTQAYVCTPPVYINRTVRTNIFCLPHSYIRATISPPHTHAYYLISPSPLHDTFCSLHKRKVHAWYRYGWGIDCLAHPFVYVPYTLISLLLVIGHRSSNSKKNETVQ